MMFSNDKPIFQQMADRLCDEIVAGTYKAHDRIPSVREYSVMLEVNTNTAVKTFELLARQNIIYNKRGMGYFVSEGAREHIVTERKRVFLQQTLPELFRQMGLLGLTLKDVEKAWHDVKK